MLSDAQWETIQPLFPTQRPLSGRPRRDHRQVVEGITYRYRCGITWRDLRADLGPWQTVWKRHRAWAADDTWEHVLDAFLMRAIPDGELDWSAEVDSTICHAHEHGTNLEQTMGRCGTARISASSRLITRWIFPVADSRSVQHPGNV